MLATDRLVVGGRSYTGFPLLLDDQCKAMQPAQTFLWWLLGKAGRTDSKSTWEAYGRAMYDYFAFLYRNKITWDTPQPIGLSSPVVAYRDWSKGVLALDPVTINQRLRIVVRFYEWAKKTGLIAEVPFDYVSIQTYRQPGFLAHTDASGGVVQSPDILLREKQQQIKFLTKEQIIVCHAALMNKTHRLMFELMVRTGLRQVECRTFPEKYVFDPSRRKDLTAGQKIRLRLDPRDMKIKFDKPRDIDVPYGLMQELWDYSVRHRQKRERNEVDGKTHPVMFLTEAGRVYSQEAMTQMYRTLTAKVRFDVRPHMLRHSYATYLLWSLRRSEAFQGEPLLYVRDRMGHSDVSTTAIYLHLINSLEGHVVLEHEDEIDSLFARGAGHIEG
ncbi:MAG: site-specific integrase [Pseudomonadota bacterium]